jgi:hypothetical protein
MLFLFDAGSPLNPPILGGFRCRVSEGMETFSIFQPSSYL